MSDISTPASRASSPGARRGDNRSTTSSTGAAEQSSSPSNSKTQAQQQQQPHSSPYGNETGQSTINHRVLLSLKESAKVIGTKGSTIQRIRETNHVKIGLSEKQLGCSDRVLSCAGRLFNVSNSLGDVVAVLTEGAHPPYEEKKYAFHFLNPILPAPKGGELKDPEQIAHIGILRLMVTNSQLSSVIGKGGVRIKALKQKHDVKIVASRDFLPDSDERILEMQGFPGSIKSAVMEISEILLNELGISFTSERRYYPHLRSPATSGAASTTATGSAAAAAAGAAAGGAGGQVDFGNYSSNEFRTPLKIPESYVGAIVGRQGNRIANLRKFSKTKIIVEKKSKKSPSDDPDPENRMFIILGDHLKNVKLAESMLLKNLDAEIEKRHARLAKSNASRQTKPTATIEASSSPPLQPLLQSFPKDKKEDSL